MFPRGVKKDRYSPDEYADDYETVGLQEAGEEQQQEEEEFGFSRVEYLERFGGSSPVLKGQLLHEEVDEEGRNGTYSREAYNEDFFASQGRDVDYEQ